MDYSNMNNTNTNDPEYLEAQKRVQKIKKFYRNLFQWIGTSIFLVAINVVTTGSITWARFPIFFWGISILIGYFKIRSMQKYDGEWEKREMEKQLGRELPASRYEPMTEMPKEKTEDYTSDLLNQETRQRELADLKDVRSLKKSWKDEDLV